MSNPFPRPHTFHIPVMGTGFSIDTPLRVAPFGLTSVVSLVDDLLIERVHGHHAAEAGIAFSKVPPRHPDARSRRIKAYLDFLHERIQAHLGAIRELPLHVPNAKQRYFQLMPDDHPLKLAFKEYMAMARGAARDVLEARLTAAMVAGDIEANIMVKLDRLNTRSVQASLSDAQSALKGFADSIVESSVVFSAGINQALFGFMTRFKEFYRDQSGALRKRITLKVSDFRSALIQARFLAKKGLEVSEYRIESGLNCGGHAFASPGHLLPTILFEFRERRHELIERVQPLIQRFYTKQGWDYSPASEPEPRITVQGGLGTFGEAQRLQEEYQINGTGWASPFLLVPEVTRVAVKTRRQLAEAEEKDLYLSHVSPLGVPFNNLRGSTSEFWTRQRLESGRPGSPCPKGYLISNAEFTDDPICTASREYQTLKFEEVGTQNLDPVQREKVEQQVAVKTCLCDHLGNSALIDLGISGKSAAPEAICPGPNSAYFDREYSLEEMIDQIYGRREDLVPVNRPHMFAKELQLYVDYLDDLVANRGMVEAKPSELKIFLENLESSIGGLRLIGREEAYRGENLASIHAMIDAVRPRIDTLSRKIKSMTEHAQTA